MRYTIVVKSFIIHTSQGTGRRAQGIEHGAWGMGHGHGAWGMGHGAWAWSMEHGIEKLGFVSLIEEMGTMRHFDFTQCRNGDKGRCGAWSMFYREHRRFYILFGEADAEEEIISIRKSDIPDFSNWKLLTEARPPILFNKIR